MQIFNQDEDKYTKDQPRDKDGNEREVSFFHRSEMNDWTPIWEKICFFLLGFIGLRVLSLVLSSIMMATPFYDTENMSLSIRGQNILNFTCYLSLAVAFVLFIFLDKRMTYKRVFSGFKDKKTYLYALVGLFCIFAVNYLFSFIYQVFVPTYGQNANQTGLDELIKDQWFLSFLPVVILAPFTEELTYRIGLLDSIGHKKRILGIILSSIIFGCIHFDFNCFFYLQMAETAEELLTAQQYAINELLNLPIYILSGAILGTVYASSGKISASMTCHLSNNLISFLITIISVYAPIASQNPSSVSFLRLFF